MTDEEEKKREEDGEDKPEWNRGRVVKKESRSLPGYLVRRLIVRACSRLKLSDRTRSRALGLGSLLRESRSSPRGVAAGCVYLAGRLCEEPRTQYQVADAVRVTEVTVRANYQVLSRRIGLKPEHARERVSGLARSAEKTSRKVHVG